MDQSDLNNFFKILVSVQEYGTCAHRKIIKHQLERLKLTFCDLLNANAHELYHLYNISKCCQCGIIDKLPDIYSLRPDQYTSLFQKDGKFRLSGHPRTERDSKCCNYANTSVSPDDLDFSLTHKVLMHCCRELLWHCCLAAKKKTFEDFLNENKHDIMHMSILKEQPCRLCTNGIKAKAKGVLEKNDWDLLFVNETYDDDPSLYSARKDISTQRLSPKLSYSLLQVFSDEVKMCKQLLLIRNNLAHCKSLTIDSDEFKLKWSEVETILLHLSNVYDGATDVKYKMNKLKTEKRYQEEIHLSFDDMKRDVEKEAILFSVDEVIQFMKDQCCTKEDNANLMKQIEAMENKLMERLTLLHTVYESRSSKEIKSRELIIEIGVIGTKVTLNKSSVQFIPDSNTSDADDSNKNVVQKTLIRIVGKDGASTNETDKLLKTVQLKIRFDDPTTMVVEYESITDKGYMEWVYNTFTNVLMGVHQWVRRYVYHLKTKYLTMGRNKIMDPVGQNSINVKVNAAAAEGISETDPADEFKCGPCQETFRTIEAFLEHKRLDKERQRNGIRTNITLEGLSDKQVDDLMKYTKLKGVKVGDVTVLGKAKGSLIIWTRISVAAFKTKDTFTTAIEQLMQHIFWESPTDNNKETNLTLNVQIEDIFEDGYVDDEEDSFRCGVCLEEFFVLEAFKLHKKSPCRKDNTGSLPELTISADYLIVEYNMNAFSRFDDLQKRITLLLKDSGLQELSKDLLKYPVASLYKGDGYSNLHYTYFKSKKYLKTIDAYALQDNADTYGVMLCFLEADFGHLTNMDKKCLHKIRQELPVYLINKTLYVVTAKSFSGSFRHFHTLSHEISRETGLEMSNMIYRIFEDKDIDIFKRMSLYFEKQLIEKKDDVYRNLQSLAHEVREAIKHTNSVSFATTLRLVLLAGPLQNGLHGILRTAANSYVWNGESFTRNKFTVTDAKQKIARHVCEELGKEIVQTIIQHFENEVQSGEHDLFSLIFKHIDLDDFHTTILQSIILVLFNLVLGPFGWVMSALIIFLSGTDINSSSFRNEVADKMFTQIRQNIDQIIPEVIKKIRSNAISTYQRFEASLSISDPKIRGFLCEKENLIRKHSIESEFRIIAGKCGLIKDFKFEDNILKINVRGDLKNNEMVNDFVKTYFRRDVRTTIIFSKSHTLTLPKKANNQ